MIYTFTQFHFEPGRFPCWLFTASVPLSERDEHKPPRPTEKCHLTYSHRLSSHTRQPGTLLNYPGYSLLDILATDTFTFFRFSSSPFHTVFLFPFSVGSHPSNGSVFQWILTQWISLPVAFIHPMGQFSGGFHPVVQVPVFPLYLMFE